jgi:uncharacterized protein (TIGR03435 family)
MDARPGERLTATNATVHFLILSSYETRGRESSSATRLRDDELVGGPDWIRTHYFDIAAKAPGPATGEQLLLMLRTLLEDRFRLVIDWEPRERDIYGLTLARRDGRLGPDLRRADSDCEAEREARRAAGDQPFAQVQPSGPVPLNAQRTMGACTTIAALAAGLQRTLRTTVVDETGLTGLWDYVAYHSGTGLPPGPPPVPGLAPAPRPPSDAPTLFEAYQDQLGLKLERQRGMVDVLVIKSIEPPTEN